MWFYIFVALAVLGAGAFLRWRASRCVFPPLSLIHSYSSFTISMRVALHFLFGSCKSKKAAQHVFRNRKAAAGTIFQILLFSYWPYSRISSTRTCASAAPFGAALLRMPDSFLVFSSLKTYKSFEFSSSRPFFLVQSAAESASFCADSAFSLPFLADPRAHTKSQDTDQHWISTISSIVRVLSPHQAQKLGANLPNGVRSPFLVLRSFPQ